MNAFTHWWAHLTWSHSSAALLIAAFALWAIVRWCSRRIARSRIFIRSQELNQHRVTVTLPSSAMRDFLERK